VFPLMLLFLALLLLGAEAEEAGSIIELSADELLEAFTLPPGYKTYPFNGKRYGINFGEGAGALKLGDDLDLTYFSKGAIFDGARLCSVSGAKARAGCNAPKHSLHVSYFAPSSNQKTYVTLVGFLYTQFQSSHVQSESSATITFFDMHNRPTETVSVVNTNSSPNAFFLLLLHVCPESTHQLALQLPAKFPQRFVAYQCPPKRCHSFTLSSSNCMLQHIQYVLSEDPTQELWRQQAFAHAQKRAKVKAKNAKRRHMENKIVLNNRAAKLRAEKAKYTQEVNKLQRQINVQQK
jgi:hypothetical protein